MSQQDISPECDVQEERVVPEAAHPPSQRCLALQARYNTLMTHGRYARAGLVLRLLVKAHERHYPRGIPGHRR